jgi:hypothetical protein
MILKDMLLIVVFTAGPYIRKSVMLALSLVKSRSLGFSYSSVNIKCPFEMYALFAFSKKRLMVFLLKALMNLSILILFVLVCFQIKYQAL